MAIEGELSITGITRVAMTASWELPPPERSSLSPYTDADASVGNVHFAMIVYNKMFELQVIVDPTTRGNGLTRHDSNHDI